MADKGHVEMMKGFTENHGIQTRTDREIEKLWTKLAQLENDSAMMKHNTAQSIGKIITFIYIICFHNPLLYE